jgi:hypothetical protein
MKRERDMNEKPQPQRHPPQDQHKPDPCDYADPSDEKPCPEPKPCPPPPKRPCAPPEPDPCAETPPQPEECSPPEPPPETCDPSQTETEGKSGDTTVTTPAQQLEALRQVAEKEQRELQKFAPLQAKLADVTARIAALEKLIDGQAAAATAYNDFYRSIEVFKSALECSIPTIRCQLDLTDKQKQCIRKAIAIVEARVKRARDASDAQNAQVTYLEKRQKTLDDDLAWAKKWMDFFATTLQTQITAQRDDLKKLQALADPSKDQCEVWFYLSEMEALLRSARTNGEGEACYRDNLNVATFLDCWSPKCYTTAYQYWIVAFNDAESKQKVGQIELTEAQKRAIDLDKTAKDAESKRRDWVLKELKAQDCCGPLSKCP